MARSSGGRRPWHGTAAAGRGADAREDDGPWRRAEQGGDARIWSLPGQIGPQWSSTSGSMVLLFLKQRKTRFVEGEKRKGEGRRREIGHTGEVTGRRPEVGRGGAGHRREEQARGRKP